MWVQWGKAMCREKTLIKALSILVMVFAFSGCGREPMPTELLGTWFTSAPNYKGASMEITSETITFKNGKGYAGVNRIIDLEKSEEKEGTLFKMGYKGDDGVRFVLNFYLKHVAQGKTQQPMIVYKNQKELTWTKKAG
jgi:hypothetical protein